MKFYKISDTTDDSVIYAGTKQKAHSFVGTMPEYRREQLFIDEVDIPVDKDTVCAILNNDISFEPIRSWVGTKRGGLKLLPKEDGEEQ